MQVRPSIVIGLGSTGKYVVTNIQRFLYEVLNGQALDLINCMVIETDPAVAHDPSLPSWAGVNPISIRVENVGAAYRSLKDGLRSRFTWCPDDLIIDGPGAGNKRAGGRLMLFANMQNVQTALQTAINFVKNAADQVGPTHQINELLQQRAVAGVQTLSPDRNPAVYVVGTLAGGTCSGACVDLGYLIHRVDPTATRMGIFTITDDNANSTYRANCWAALNDLAYFVQNPQHYKASWLNLAQQPVDYDRDSTGPYDYMYLLSTRDRHDGQHLTHENGPNSPLLVMTGLFIAADLLGLNNIRQARLVNISQHLVENRLHEKLFTMSLRGVCYPKYEITEAAACEIISERICSAWLDKEQYWSGGKRIHLERETAKKLGRDTWNGISPTVWDGLRAGVPTEQLIQQISAGHIADVSGTLNREFGTSGEATIYRMVEQHVRARTSELQHAIRSRFAQVMANNQNLEFGECFLEGINDEIRRTRKYWAGLGVPADIPGKDMRASWQGKLQDLVGRLMTRRRAWLVRFIGARPALIEDEVREIQARLEMFLMDSALADLQKWITTDLSPRLAMVRDILQKLQTKAKGRAKAIVSGFNDARGPLLKISRSQQIGFEREIQSLTNSDPGIPGRDYISYDEHFSGLLPFQGQPSADFDEKLFFEFRSRIQPSLLRQLEKDGGIDIVQQITSQGVVGSVTQRAKATSRLSVALKVDAAVDPQALPAYVLAKTQAIAQNLMDVLLREQGDVPPLEAKALPLFDHMALFHQEGGRLDLDKLSHAASFKIAYEEGRQRGESVIDPLRELKTGTGAQAVAAGTKGD